MPPVSQFVKRPSSSFACQKKNTWVPLPWVFNYKYHSTPLGFQSPKAYWNRLICHGKDYLDVNSFLESFSLYCSLPCPRLTGFLHCHWGLKLALWLWIPWIASSKHDSHNIQWLYCLRAPYVSGKEVFKYTVWPPNMNLSVLLIPDVKPEIPVCDFPTFLTKPVLTFRFWGVVKLKQCNVHELQGVPYLSA